jgi:predicted RNA polymerase sigma factor
MVNALRPGDAEVEGALALLLITHARRRARVDAQGQMVALAEQDRALWDSAAIEEGVGLLEQAMARGAPGPYQIKAAIAACHVIDERADWAQIVLLYDRLMQVEPTPVVALNRAVALAEVGALELAVDVLRGLEAELVGYQPYYAALADVLRRKGKREAALAAYARAIELAASPQDAAFLERRRAQLLQ